MYFFRGQHYFDGGEKRETEGSEPHLGMEAEHFHCKPEGVGQDHTHISGEKCHFSFSLFHIHFSFLL